MVSKAFSIVVISASLGLVAACGGQDSEETTPEPQQPADTSSDGDTTSDNGSDGGDGVSQPTEPSAQLTEVIYFEFDSSALSDEARDQLEENAEWMREDDSRALTIEGHTDEVGTPEYNLALGERRARAAREFLVQLGIDESRIDIVTYGEEQPASTDHDENRRSVFVAER